MSESPDRTLITTANITVSVVFPLLSLIAVGLRLQARRKARQQLLSDDLWIIASWFFALALSINAWVFASITGINHYKVDLLAGEEKSLEAILVNSLLVQVALTVVKISILLFYKRLFPTRSFVIAVWVMITAVTCWGTILFFLVLFESDPVSASWTGLGRETMNDTMLGEAQVGTSIALDVLVLCMPLPIILKLHMTMKKKIGVILIFWLGAFCVVAAIVRLVLLEHSLHLVAENQSSIYTQALNFLFMIIEPNASIVAACLPCLGPLLAGNRMLDSIIRSIRSIVSLASSPAGSAHFGGSTRNRADIHTTPKHADDSNIELNPYEATAASVNADAKASWSVNEADEGHAFGRINVTRDVNISRILLQDV